MDVFRRLMAMNELNYVKKAKVVKSNWLILKPPDPKQSCVEQRARGDYLAPICQTEACFDLSLAALKQLPDIQDITKLTERLT